MLFPDNTEGAHRVCVLLGIVTCRAQAYRAFELERLGTHRAVFDLQLEGMTPAAFKKTLASPHARFFAAGIPPTLIGHVVNPPTRPLSGAARGSPSASRLVTASHCLGIEWRTADRYGIVRVL